MYHHDWLMRQIEIIAETLARVVFRKTPARRANRRTKIWRISRISNDRDGRAAIETMTTESRRTDAEP